MSEPGFHPEKIEHLDDKWHGRYEKFGLFEAYTYLEGDKGYRDGQKQKFLNNEINNPELDCPQIDLVKVGERRKELISLKMDILREEPTEVVRQAYRWRINEKLAELGMLKASKEGNMERFKQYNEFIYGEPSQEIFSYFLNNEASKLEAHLQSDNVELRQAAFELKQTLQPILERLPKPKVIELPDESTVTKVREQTLKEMGDLVNIPEDIEQFNAEQIKTVFEAALTKLQAEGWKVVIDRGTRTTPSVSQEHKEVIVPENQKMLFQNLRTLVAHEIGTHVARRITGENSKLKLLGYGLDRYDRGEEGVTSMREQVIDGEVKQYGDMPYLLSIGLALGLDGTPRNFREVYSILEKCFRYQALANNQPESDYKTLAYTRCVRTFRGTTGERGVAFTKDIVYGEGTIAVWRVMMDNFDECMRLSVGKYDPSNERHIWILTQLAATEQNLESIENNN